MDITLNRLAKKLGCKKEDLLKLTKERLGLNGWYENKWGGISYSPEAVEKLKLAVEIPLAVPKVFMATVKVGCPNPRYVQALLDTEPDKTKVYCAIPRRLYGRLIGKKIIVHAITDAQGNTSYRHEAC